MRRPVALKLFKMLSRDLFFLLYVDIDGSLSLDLNALAAGRGAMDVLWQGMPADLLMLW